MSTSSLHSGGFWSRFIFFIFLASLLIAGGQTARAAYPDLVLADEPAAYWRLNDAAGSTVLNRAPGSQAAALDGVIEGSVKLQQPGPGRENFPEFEPDSTAAAFSGQGGFVRVKDPGSNSALDFGPGDSITLEAWVFLNRIQNGQQVYIFGKGRTGNKGFASNNQNYALRLRGEAGSARISFLFRSEASGKGNSEDHWHRWTSTTGLWPNSGWHHVAVTYTFGKGNSIKGYLDGVEVKGKWDMGGPSDAAPVVDDDELWIGSSMGGSAGSSFHGLINEVALYRRALSAADMKKRFTFVPTVPKLTSADLPKGAVRVEIIENLPPDLAWNFVPGPAVETFTEPAFGFVRVPVKYSERGVRVDRSAAFLVRAAAAVHVPAGEHRLLLRSLNSARLFMDGHLVAMTPFIIPNGSGHGEVPPIPTDLPPGLRFARSGHNEQFVSFKTDGGVHVFVLEAFVGGKTLRPEIGELSVSISVGGGLFQLLSPGQPIPHTDEGWTAHVENQLQRLAVRDTQRRQEIAVAEAKYWAARHEHAREVMAQVPAPTMPQVSASLPVNNPIDHFIGAKLEAAKVQPAPLIDDWAFLRRVSLDVTGLVPSPEQIREFVNDRSSARRAKAIDRLLEHPGWADHWVSYWQDVLAENPGILKPTLNNTGPFRWWIHESFLDNKPMDRFATELVRMEGSVYYGGPAGFGMATQNDVPMADRAQVISQAFLGMNMACARCHDAPYHDFKQKDLFNLAAMLKQGPQEIPPSSSIPPNANITVGRLVEVTLRPGEKVEPAWPFPDLIHATAGVRSPGFSRPGPPEGGTPSGSADSREQLAAFITDPRNERFASVMVNRLWKRYFGLGLIEPVDDWETAKPSHPELLQWLARELVTHNYDLKHVARLILNSHAYQRVAGLHPPASDKPEERLFASPARRRLTAEQLVDSLYAAAGKPLRSEQLTLDDDGRRAAKDFLNLGYPSRAWEFTSLSNDRDRPALAMPRTQEIVNLLGMFGWREARQNALSAREDAPNVLQPAVLANGDLNNGRISRLSDECAITQLCTEEAPLAELVENVFLRVLSRTPAEDELAIVLAHLQPGYSDRVLPAPPAKLEKEYDPTLLLSWSNHLNARATEIKLEVERRARLGDEPTPRLRPAWRERMEDLLWAMVNSPEFVFVP